MTYRGQVKNGVVVFENGTPPEGARVRVQVLDAPIEPEPAEQTGPSPLWSKMLRLAGTVEGLPPDFAENHDHYIHGTPKCK